MNISQKELDAVKGIIREHEDSCEIKIKLLELRGNHPPVDADKQLTSQKMNF